MVESHSEYHLILAQILLPMETTVCVFVCTVCVCFPEVSMLFGWITIHFNTSVNSHSCSHPGSHPSSVSLFIIFSISLSVGNIL